mmetsp:Transcript_43393/g.70394  ORF Transcript_43393/g.70394 Transcript_43393/m.70394 type:complete len:312 (-) Transcript_43393:162-1097(-)
MRGIARSTKTCISIVVVLVCVLLVAREANKSSVKEKTPGSLVSEKGQDDSTLPESSDGGDTLVVGSAKKVKKTVTDSKRWWYTQSFKDKWTKRSRGAVGFVKQYFYENEKQSVWESSLQVLDIGCGPHFLVSTYLPETAAYTPCDIVKRDKRTHVIDLNLGDDEIGTPNPDGDVPESLDTIRRTAGSEVNLVTMLGVAEYVVDVSHLFLVLKRFNCPVMITYSTLEMVPDKAYRKKMNGWISHYSSGDLMELIRSSGFNCFKKTGSTLFYLMLPATGDADPCVEVSLAKEYLGEPRNLADAIPHHLRHLFL